MRQDRDAARPDGGPMTKRKTVAAAATVVLAAGFGAGLSGCGGAADKPKAETTEQTALVPQATAPAPQATVPAPTTVPADGWTAEAEDRVVKVFTTAWVQLHGAKRVPIAEMVPAAKAAWPQAPEWTTRPANPDGTVDFTTAEWADIQLVANGL